MIMPGYSATGVGHPVSCVFRSGQPAKTENLDQLQRQMDTYRIRRNAGIGLMSGGAAAIVIGEVVSILSVVRAENGNYRYYSSTQDPLWIAGFSTTMAGVGGLASGIPLFVIYNKRYKAVRHRIKKISEGKTDIIIE